MLVDFGREQIAFPERLEMRMRLGRNSLVVGVSILLTLLPAGVAESVPSRLKVGETFPALHGEVLTGRQVDLPIDAGISPALVVLAFSRAGGRDAQTWEQRVAKDFPQVAIYNVVFLEEVPRLFRHAAISGIRGGMPGALHDRTILLYGDEGLWKQRLQVADESKASVILLGPKGIMRWIGIGPFADAGYAALSKEIRSGN